MTAEATADSAAGTASTSLLPADPARPVVAAALSATRIDAKPDGSVVARAESVVEGASFPGGLRIARIQSVAVATLMPGADSPAVETTTTVIGAEVAGTPVEIGPDGITRPQPAGLPAGSLAPAEQSLAQAGISVRRISGAPVAGGASADLIEVRSTVAAPAPGIPASTASFDLAGASASVLTGAGFGSAPLLPTPPVGEAAPQEAQPLPASPGPVGGEVSPPASDASVRPAPLPATDARETAFGVAAPPGDELSAAPAALTPEAAGPPLGTAGGTADRFASARPAANLRRELGLLNLVVIVGGLAAFAFASIFRTKGVQRTWNS